MKRLIAVTTIVILSIGCTTLLKITAGALSFIGTVDKQAQLYCELGYIPEAACEKYVELKAKAEKAWSENKDKLLDWVIEFILRNTAALGGADVTAEEASRDILISAEMNLVYADYMRLKSAVQ